MPVVDLSNIGLEGQQAFATRMATLAQSRQMEANAREQELANQETEQMNAVGQEAAAYLSSIGKGERRVNIDPNTVASKMDSLASPLEVTAEIAARYGLSGKAMEFSKAASEIRKRESDIENDAVLAEQRRLENIIKGGDLVSRTLGIARNQSEWDYGVEQLRKQGIMEAEQLEQIAQMPFDPDLAAYFNEQAISAADRARNDLTRSGQERQERQFATTRAQEERKIRLQQQRDAAQERHRVWERKNGGKNAPNATAPTARDVESVEALLRTDIFRGVGKKDPDVKAAAEYVASQAKSILQNNKAISWDTAVQQAILRGQQDGALSIDPAKNEWFRSIPIVGGGDVPAKGRFKAPVGKTPETATPIPMKNGAYDKSKMKKGAYYILPDGRVDFWNGK